MPGPSGGASRRWWPYSHSRNLSRLKGPKFHKDILPAVEEDRVGHRQEQGSGIPGRSSGRWFWSPLCLSAPETLGNAPTGQQGLGFLSQNQKCRPDSTLVAFSSERTRRKHTSNAQQRCQRIKYFGPGDENNSN